MNEAVTAGIIDGFDRGLLTSASILANGPGFTDAVARWKRLNEDRAAGRLSSRDGRLALGDGGERLFDVGVHLNLTQGMPLTPGFPAQGLDDGGRFAGIAAVVGGITLDTSRWLPGIIAELSAQIERVVAAGLRPTHLNGHHYIELVPALADPIAKLAERFQIPAVRAAREQDVWLAWRDHPSPVLNTTLALVKRGLADRLRQTAAHDCAYADAVCGTAHAGRMSLDVLRRSIAGLQPGATLEIILHPGHAPATLAPAQVEEGWRDSIAELRPAELAMLTSAQLFDMLAAAGVSLGRIASASRAIAAR